MSHSSVRLLIIGYGSTLHSDDGVGQWVAQQVEAWQRSDVCALATLQLLPEHADLIARAQQVIFVDATRDALSDSFAAFEIQPDTTRTLTPHRADPRALLALAQALYGATPRAHMLTIRGFGFDLGESLSPQAQAAAKAALRWIESRAKGS